MQWAGTVGKESRRDPLACLKLQATGELMQHIQMHRMAFCPYLTIPAVSKGDKHRSHAHCTFPMGLTLQPWRRWRA